VTGVQTCALPISVSIVSKAADAKLLIKGNIPDISLQMDKEQAHDYWRTSKQSPVNYLIADDRRSKELVRLLQKYIGTGRILEIGCNAGRNLKHLYQAGFTDLEGIEISPTAVKTLRENHPELSGIHIHTGAVEDCIESIPDYSFECVFTMAVLEHIHYKSDWIFSKISRLARFVVTIEDEISFGKRHFPRSYDKVFEKLGMRQVHFEKCSQWGLPKSFVARVFQNNDLIK
jgi:SAM-dependent methyltransferase